MKNLKIYLLGLGAVLLLVGCGTTVKDTLGDPPLRPSNLTGTTAVPYGYVKFDDGVTVTIAGNATEAYTEVFVLSQDGNELGKGTANSKGNYEINITSGPKMVYLQARGVNKNPSSLLQLPVTIGF